MEWSEGGPIIGWRRKSMCWFPFYRKIVKKKIEIVTFHAKNVPAHIQVADPLLYHMYTLSYMCCCVFLYVREPGLVSYTWSFDYFKIKKQHAEVGWRNEKILVNLFQQRQKNRHLSRYICFHFTAGREIQCWMANFLCAVTWRTHGGTREQLNTKTRVASPQLFAFYNEEELE